MVVEDEILGQDPGRTALLPWEVAVLVASFNPLQALEWLSTRLDGVDARLIQGSCTGDWRCELRRLKRFTPWSGLNFDMTPELHEVVPRFQTPVDL